MFVLRQDTHLLDGLVAEDDCKAVDAGAGHPRRQPLPEHAPSLRHPEVADRLGDAPSVDLE